MDYKVTWLHGGHEYVTACNFAAAGGGRRFEIRTDVVSVGYLHPYVLAHDDTRSVSDAQRIANDNTWHSNLEL
jgi:hypothetical protein